MTDLHTHILPGMDDGAENAEVSIEMLKLEAADGCSRVAFTPHFYPERESVADFLSRRSAAEGRLNRKLASLPEQELELLPKYICSAEVAWYRELADLPGLEKLCYENTRYLLVELPMFAWSGHVIDSLEDILNRTGLIPVIAHLDRHYSTAGTRAISELCSLELPIQISTNAFNSLKSRRISYSLLRQGAVRYLISDCHDAEFRKPNLLSGYEKIAKHFDTDRAEWLKRVSDNLI